MVRVAAALNVLGSDDIYPSPRLQNLMVRNNVFEIDTSMGGNGIFVTITSAPANITFDHNTIINTGTIVNVGGPPVSRFTYTDQHVPSQHLWRAATAPARPDDPPNYGIGLSTLQQYFPRLRLQGPRAGG